MVSTGIDQNLRVWDLESGKLIRSLNNHTLPVPDLALRPGETGLPMAASAGEDRTVRSTLAANHRSNAQVRTTQSRAAGRGMAKQRL